MNHICEVLFHQCPFAMLYFHVTSCYIHVTGRKDNKKIWNKAALLGHFFCRHCCWAFQMYFCEFCGTLSTITKMPSSSMILQRRQTSLVICWKPGNSHQGATHSKIVRFRMLQSHISSDEGLTIVHSNQLLVLSVSLMHNLYFYLTFLIFNLHFISSTVIVIIIALFLHINHLTFAMPALVFTFHLHDLH